MAYNTWKGDAALGDVVNQDDIDTLIDWENDYISLKTDGTARLTVSGSNIGFGTTSPSALTHLYKAATTSPQTVEMMRLQVSDEGVDMNIGSGPGIDFYVGETGGSNYGGTVAVVREEASDADSDAAMVFHTATDDQTPETDREKMRITSTGKVGIGTTSPTSLLAVAGSISGSSTLEAVGATILGSTLTVSGAATVAGSISGSSTLEAVGATILGSTLTVSGAATLAGTVSVAQKIEHTGDTDTYIDFTADSMAVNVGGEAMILAVEGAGGDQADKVAINNGATDVDFQVKGSSALVPNLIRTDAANNRVGIGHGAGNLSGSTTLSVIGSFSGSSTLEAVGATILGSTLNVSGAVTLAGPASGSLAGPGSYLGVTAAGVLILTESAGGGGGISWDGSTANGIATFKDSDEATVESNLTFDGTTLTVTGDSSLNGEVTINDAGADKDFRVESVDESHMIFVEGSSNRMSIGDSTDAPAATLEITNASDAGVPLVQLNSNDTDKIAVDINAANIDANVLDITADAVTTAKVINVSADALSTGNAFVLMTIQRTQQQEILHL